MDETAEAREQEAVQALRSVLGTIDFDRKYYAIVAKQARDLSLQLRPDLVKQALAPVETPAPFRRWTGVKGGYLFEVRDGPLLLGLGLLVKDGYFEAILRFTCPRGRLGMSFNTYARWVASRRDPPYEHTPAEPRVGYSSADTFSDGVRAVVALWHEAVAALLAERFQNTVQSPTRPTARVSKASSMPIHSSVRSKMLTASTTSSGLALSNSAKPVFQPMVYSPLQTPFSKCCQSFRFWNFPPHVHPSAMSFFTPG
jgi:hypothetical protein